MKKYGLIVALAMMLCLVSACSGDNKTNNNANDMVENNTITENGVGGNTNSDSLVDDTNDAIDNVVDGVGDGINDVVDGVTEGVEDITDGIADGVDDMTDSVTDNTDDSTFQGTETRRRTLR